jgi:hypothetical protein
MGGARPQGRKTGREGFRRFVASVRTGYVALLVVPNHWDLVRQLRATSTRPTALRNGLAQITETSPSQSERNVPAPTLGLRPILLSRLHRDHAVNKGTRMPPRRLASCAHPFSRGTPVNRGGARRRD